MDIKQQNIVYIYTNTILGWLMLASSDNKLCYVQMASSVNKLMDNLYYEYPGANYVASSSNDEPFSSWLSKIGDYILGRIPRAEIDLAIHGTDLQKKVWQYLQTIDYGVTVSYSQIAAALQEEKAVRAIANACGRNKFALIIPCHRVIRSDNKLSGYRWGKERKAALIELERSRNVESFFVA